MSPVLKAFLQRWIINILAVLVATQMVDGIKYKTPTGLIVATLVLGILNAFVRPVMMLLSLPLLVFTLGLFTLVINALLLYFVGHVLDSFQVDSFRAAFWGALVISIVSLFLNSLTGTGQSRIEVRRKKGAVPPADQDGSNGPVIDV